GNNPDSGLKLSSCGETEPVGIVYSPAGPLSGGLNFFLQQDDTQDIFHLRGVDLTTDFDMAQTMSWGAFSTALDSMCVTTSGYVVGVTRAPHKMLVLRLPVAPSSIADEVPSYPFAALSSGYGSRVGLLDTPVAVTSHDGAFLVLEQGNRRVQAF